MAHRWEIKTDLRDALEGVQPGAIDELDRVAIVAAYLWSLRIGRGLAEEHGVSVEPPLGAQEFIAALWGLPLGGLDQKVVGDRLVGLFIKLSRNTDILHALDKSGGLAEDDMLKIAQIAWNLAHDPETRPDLPILSSAKITVDGLARPAWMKVEGQQRDFAELGWTARTNIGAVLPTLPRGRTSGQAFRTKAALLAVYAARQMIDDAGDRLPILARPVLTDDAIIWPDSETSGDRLSTVLQREEEPSHRNVPAVIGNPREVFADQYLARAFDAQMRERWAGDGDRRVWLSGGPGLGKSFSARRVVTEALSERVDIVIWVDASDAQNTARSLARAAHAIPELGVEPPSDVDGGEQETALRVIDSLRTTELSWLVVLDDARPDEIIEAGLVPPGTNRRGRTLATTLSTSPAMAAHGCVLSVEPYSTAEATSQLEAALPQATAEQRDRLIREVDRHPLALSIAAATISEERMAPDDWISDFRTTDIDDAADRNDLGGYPHLVGAAWQVAVAKASQGQPTGAVERAALAVALQSTTGSPTWLWQRNPVIEWLEGDVEGSYRARPGRVPRAFKALFDYGIAVLDGTWTAGHTRIHQLAARAIRERADPADIDALSAILADQWLMTLTERPDRAQPDDVRANLVPLIDAAHVSDVTQDVIAAVALEVLPSQEGPEELRTGLDELAFLERHVASAGVTGQTAIAEQLMTVANTEQRLGRDESARRRRERAAEMYTTLTGHPKILDVERAGYLEQLAELEDALDRPANAREHRESAQELTVRISGMLREPYLQVSMALRRAYLWLALGEESQQSTALDEASRYAAEYLDDLSRTKPTGREKMLSVATLSESGSRFREHGRLEDARVVLERATGMTADDPTDIYHMLAWTALGRVNAQRGEWRVARGNLLEARIQFHTAMDDVVLASVEMHIVGYEDSARARLAGFAERYRRQHSGVAARGQSSLASAVSRGWGSMRLRALAHRAGAHERWDEAYTLETSRLAVLEDRGGDLHEHQGELALSHSYLAEYARELDDDTALRRHLIDAVSIGETLMDLAPEDPYGVGLQLGVDALHLALVYSKQGNAAESARLNARAESLLAAQDDFESRARILRAFRARAETAARFSQYESSAVWRQCAVAAWRRALPDDAPNMLQFARDLAAFSQILWMTGEHERVLDSARETQSVLAGLRLDDVGDAGGAESLEGTLLLAIALEWHALYSLERNEEALPVAHRLQARRGSILDRDPTDISRQYDLGTATMYVGATQQRLGRHDKATEELTRAEHLSAMMTELDPARGKTQQVALLAALESSLREVGCEEAAADCAARARDLHDRFPDPDD